MLSNQKLINLYKFYQYNKKTVLFILDHIDDSRNKNTKYKIGQINAFSVIDIDKVRSITEFIKAMGFISASRR